MIFPLARRRSLLATLMLGALAVAGSGARASDAPHGHGDEPAVKEGAAKEPAVKEPAAKKVVAPAPIVVAPPPSPVAQDPMGKLREKLATRLGAAPVADATKPNVMSVALKSPAPAESEAARATSSHAAVATAVRSKPAPSREPAKEPASHDTAAAHWSYEGSGSPAAWSTLKPEFAKCSNGTRQSPIDIQGGIRVDLEPVQFDYKPSAFRVLDNGHTVQVNVAPGNSIEVGGRRFDLVQFHFHRPSEERINGKQFDMVAHLVHKDLDGRLAVVAVLLERGGAHAVVQSVWNNLPLEKGEEQAARTTMNVAELLPADRSYFTYMGSLTTPPCSEGVLWMVMKTPVPISASQIDIFAHLYPMNARPIQASAGRLIKQSN